MEDEREISCARIAQSVYSTCAVARSEVGIDGKIVLGFLRAGLDEKPIGRSRGKWFGPGIANDGLHAANAVAVGKHFYRSGIGVGFQFPGGKGIFVALKSAHGDNF